MDNRTTSRERETAHIAPAPGFYISQIAGFDAIGRDMGRRNPECFEHSSRVKQYVYQRLFTQKPNGAERSMTYISSLDLVEGTSQQSYAHFEADALKRNGGQSQDLPLKNCASLYMPPVRKGNACSTNLYLAEGALCWIECQGSKRS